MTHVTPVGARGVNPDDLLVMLTVARLGKFTAAAEALGLNHTTVSRRIAGLEKAMGGKVLVGSGQGWELTELGASAMGAAQQIEAAMASLAGERSSLAGTLRVACPEGFGVHVATPAAVAMQRAHPNVSVEIFPVTQRVQQQRSGLDLEIVVEQPNAPRAQCLELRPYTLGLFASRDYLDENGAPASLADLAEHPFIYYVETSLRVDELDRASDALPRPARSLRSTSIFAHLAATRAGGGVGLLPTWLAGQHPDLVRVIPTYAHEMHYWAVIRRESARSPRVAAFMEHLHQHLATLG